MHGAIRQLDIAVNRYIRETEKKRLINVQSHPEVDYGLASEIALDTVCGLFLLFGIGPELGVPA